MSYKKSDDRKNVVVVGGGSAGSAAARALSQKLDPARHNLILINPRPYFIFYIATARLAVSDHDRLEDTAFIPYDKLFINGNGTFKQGSVAAIEPNKDGKGGEVVLQNEERVAYDALVLCPGSQWEGPLAFPDDTEEVKSFIKTQRDQFKKAKNIILVGGGAVGIEFAGEIKDIWPEKKVTIVQGDSQLLNKTYPAKFRASMEQNVRKRGIEIVFNEYIDDFSTGPDVTTRSGKRLGADLVVNTRGPRPNTGFIETLGSGSLTERGLVKVRPTLQLSAHDDIFAAGDVLDIKEQKQAAKAGAHAAIVAANIASYIDGKPLPKLYKGSYELIVITNGKGGGTGYFGVLWGIVVGDFFARLIKSKDLMVAQARKGVGY